MEITVKVKNVCPYAEREKIASQLKEAGYWWLGHMLLNNYVRSNSNSFTSHDEDVSYKELKGKGICVPNIISLASYFRDKYDTTDTCFGRFYRFQQFRRDMCYTPYSSISVKINSDFNAVYPIKQVLSFKNIYWIKNPAHESPIIKGDASDLVSEFFNPTGEHPVQFIHTTTGKTVLYRYDYKHVVYTTIDGIVSVPNYSYGRNSFTFLEKNLIAPAL